MQNIIICCLFALFLTNLCLHALSSEFDEIYRICHNKIEINSDYLLNREQLSSSFSTEAVARQGFSENTIGATTQNQISGLVLCRGNANSSICNSCINQSFTHLSVLCPYSHEATVYFDFYLLSYSNQQYFLNSTVNRNKIPNMPSTRFSGWIHRMMIHKDLIYGLSQCTPDFSNNACRACLEDLIYQMLKIFYGQQETEVSQEEIMLATNKHWICGAEKEVQILPLFDFNQTVNVSEPASLEREAMAMPFFR
ncbi:putative receptor-like protein kinase [Carex littledalei]|uniref:Putative receptor-like protein kinase n=1 Tax=Carex littledalei TaxID=544730 RepID=A0A833RD99_9POAL|nr:putative receptor-like protein kinase [Carex littledalei]